MFIRPLISLQEKGTPLFLDEEHNEELFNYQYYRQEKMNALMMQLIGSGHNYKYTSTIKFSLVIKLRSSTEYNDIANRINCGKKVHSTEYAFFVLLTSDVNQLDIEMMKRLQHIINTEYSSDKCVSEMKSYYEHFQSLMNCNLGLIIQALALKTALFPSVMVYLISQIRVLLKKDAYINMQHIDLSGMDLSNIDFRNVFLDGARFNSSKLSGVTFRDCSLHNIDMRNIAGTYESKQIPAIRCCSMDNANLDGINVLIDNSELNASSLVNAEIVCSFSRFSQCDFTDCKITMSDLTSNGTFHQCDLSHAQFESRGQWRRITMNQVKLFKDAFYTAEEFGKIYKNVMREFVESETSKIKQRINSGGSWMGDKADAEAKNIVAMEHCVASSIVYSLDCLSISLADKEFILKAAIDYFISRQFSYTNVASSFLQSIFVTDHPEKSRYQTDAIRVLTESHKMIAAAASTIHTNKIV